MYVLCMHTYICTHTHTIEKKTPCRTHHAPRRQVERELLEAAEGRVQDNARRLGQRLEMAVGGLSVWLAVPVLPGLLALGSGRLEGRAGVGETQRMNRQTKIPGHFWRRIMGSVCRGWVGVSSASLLNGSNEHSTIQIHEHSNMSI